MLCCIIASLLVPVSIPLAIVCLAAGVYNAGLLMGIYIGIQVVARMMMVGNPIRIVGMLGLLCALIAALLAIGEYIALAIVCLATASYIAGLLIGTYIGIRVAYA